MMGPNKDLLNFDTIPDETKENIVEIRSKKPEIMVIDLFDKIGDDTTYQHFTKYIKIMVDWITKGDSQIVDYSKFDKDTANKKGSSIILFSGKYKGFNEYQKEGSFDDLFGRVIDTIKETNIPIIGFCAGHQLYSIAYGGSVEYIQELDNNQKLTIFGKHEMPSPILPKHPLYNSVNLLLNNKVHYNNNQLVISNNSKSRILSIKKTKNNKGMIGAFDHVDEDNLSHHIITHQYHPEKLFVNDKSREIDIKTQEENPAGLVLLINSINLLSSPDKYTKTKKEFYNI